MRQVFIVVAALLGAPIVLPSAAGQSLPTSRYVAAESCGATESAINGSYPADLAAIVAGPNRFITGDVAPGSGCGPRCTPTAGGMEFSYLDPTCTDAARLALNFSSSSDRTARVRFAGGDGISAGLTSIYLPPGLRAKFLRHTSGVQAAVEADVTGPRVVVIGSAAARLLSDPACTDRPQGFTTLFPPCLGCPLSMGDFTMAISPPVIQSVLLDGANRASHHTERFYEKIGLLDNGGLDGAGIRPVRRGQVFTVTAKIKDLAPCDDFGVLSFDTMANIPGFRWQLLKPASFSQAMSDLVNSPNWTFAELAPRTTQTVNGDRVTTVTLGFMTPMTAAIGEYTFQLYVTLGGKPLATLSDYADLDHHIALLFNPWNTGDATHPQGMTDEEDIFRTSDKLIEVFASRPFTIYWKGDLFKPETVVQFNSQISNGRVLRTALRLLRGTTATRSDPGQVSRTLAQNLIWLRRSVSPSDVIAGGMLAGNFTNGPFGPQETNPSRWAGMRAVRTTTTCWARLVRRSKQRSKFLQTTRMCKPQPAPGRLFSCPGLRRHADLSRWSRASTPRPRKTTSSRLGSCTRLRRSGSALCRTA